MPTDDGIWPEAGMGSGADVMLSALPDTFRYSEAIKLIGERALRSLVSTGRVHRVARGVYRKDDVLGDDDLVEIALRVPRATLCLQTALVRHDLIDDIPGIIDAAIPRGEWTPTTRAPVRWRHFDAATFDIERQQLSIPGGTIAIYSPERSIVDAFRLRHLVGYETATDALKTWLRRGGQPSTLLRVAKSFPRVFTPHSHDTGGSPMTPVTRGTPSGDA